MGREHSSHDDGALSVSSVESSSREHDAFEGEPRLGDVRRTIGIALFEMNAGVCSASGRQ